jgi:lipid-binding SYLF domain-containing protein
MKAANIGLALLLAPAAAGLLTLTGCGSTPSTPAEKADLADESMTRLKELTRAYPALQTTLDNSYAYAIFPSVAKGGFGIEGGSGRADVYEQGKYIGTAHVTLIKVGAVAGGETYTELLVFKTKAALDMFKSNQLQFAASAGATALKAGADVTAKYDHDVAVYTRTNGGLDFDASIGGQQFTFTADGSMTNPATMPSSGNMNTGTSSPATMPSGATAP